MTKPSKQEIFFMLEEFLKENYVFRFNNLLDQIEFKPANDECKFKTLNKRAFASISVAAIKAGIPTTAQDVKLILESDVTPDSDPINDWLNSLPEWDGKDRIDALAAKIPTKCTYWNRIFHLWFLGMVAGWMQKNPDQGNCIVPVLIGAQGCGKSTFCRNILPQQFHFAYAESLNMNNKIESERSLGRFLLINLDEFDQITKNRQGWLKNILQAPSVKIRKLFSNNIQEIRRYASFIATTNQSEIFYDQTGNRRYAPVEITGLIDTESEIDYEQLYAQALAELKNGEPYWMSKEDEKMLEQFNKEHLVMSAAMQAFSQHFRRPEAGETGVWLTPSDMISQLNAKSHSRIDPKQCSQLGKELKGLGFECKRRTLGQYYHVAIAG